METKIDYKLMTVFGHKHVVTYSDRPEYSYKQKCLDEDGNVIVDAFGIPKIKKWIMEAPAYLGIKGMVLCGVLKKNETIEEWIVSEEKRKQKIRNTHN